MMHFHSQFFIVFKKTLLIEQFVLFNAPALPYLPGVPGTWHIMRPPGQKENDKVYIKVRYDAKNNG